MTILALSKGSLRLSLTILILAFVPWLRGQQINQKKVDLAYVESIAKKAALTEYKPASEIRPIPQNLRNLDYAKYRAIHTHPDKVPWKAENLNFLLNFFHPGYLYQDTVIVHEYCDRKCERVSFRKEIFEYGSAGVDTRFLPDDLGYSGIRLSYPLNGKGSWDEVAVFQGASYYRMVSKGQVYGLSARGLGINCGRTDVPEEFPVFTRFWVGKPAANDETIELFALLEGKCVTGAYRFEISPGDETVADVSATLYFRKQPKSVCIATLTSMFWFGENTTGKPDDFRPEIHDSDGMVIKTGSGQCIWRPISIDPTRSHFNVFCVDKLDGFGLLQRDRSVDTYQDGEAQYHNRPGIWIEPVGDWGKGNVVLVEFPTKDETEDNIVAYWEPEIKPSPHVPYRIRYTQKWTGDANPAKAGAVTRATRTGLLPWRPGERLMVVDFAGDSLTNTTENDRKEPIEAKVEAVDPTVAEISDVTVHYVDSLNVWRVTFYLRPPNYKRPEGMPDQMLSPKIERAAELRAYLARGKDILTETWTYRVDP